MISRTHTYPDLQLNSVNVRHTGALRAEFTSDRSVERSCFMLEDDGISGLMM